MAPRGKPDLAEGVAVSTLAEGVAVSTSSKLVLVVIDGLGGLPQQGKTELECAKTPHLDKLAREGITGMADPIGLGITPGSGPAHLALFGYDPEEFIIGRGALAAAGIGFELGPKDVAARVNFATLDKDENITDRRAERISTEKNQELCRLLGKINLGTGIELFIRTVKEHRAVVIFRGEGLSDELNDSDPQRVGKSARPVEVLPNTPEGQRKVTAERTKGLVGNFIQQAKELLKDHHPANTILLRGFAKCPALPSFQKQYKLNPAAIAAYPMYRGIAKYAGMEVLATGTDIAEEFKTLEDNFSKYDFFYLHIKGSDSAGEDGDFQRKVKVIEEVDKNISRLTALKPAVIVVTGDHSTPAVLGGHSWHAVPFLLYADSCRPDAAGEFSEKSCSQGGLGRFPALKTMSLLLAHGFKLGKYGA